MSCWVICFASPLHLCLADPPQPLPVLFAVFLRKMVEAQGSPSTSPPVGGKCSTQAGITGLHSRTSFSELKRGREERRKKKKKSGSPRPLKEFSTRSGQFSDLRLCLLKAEGHCCPPSASGPFRATPATGLTSVTKAVCLQVFFHLKYLLIYSW